MFTPSRQRAFDEAIAERVALAVASAGADQPAFDHLQAAMQQMQIDMQKLREDAASAINVANGKAEAAVATAARAVATSAAAAPPRREPASSMRIPPPTAYEGAGANQLEEWLAAMQQQFAFYDIDSDERQIKTAAAFLKGPARDWWQHLGAAAPTTWRDLDHALRARFQPVTSQEIARSKLRALEQGKASINDYVAAFRRLIIHIPRMDAESTLSQFTHGLKPSLNAVVRERQPSTLEDAISLVVRVGTAMPHPAGQAAAAASVGAAMDLSALVAQDTTYEPPTDGDLPVSRAELAMHLAAMQQRGGPRRGAGGRGAGGGPRQPHRGGLPTIPGLTPIQVKEYMDMNKCFTCSEIGHRSNVCSRARPAPGN